jgi:sugar phosphate isomerase/epimerase
MMATASAAVATSPLLAAAGEGARRMKIGIYSITYLGVWYRGDAMPLKGFMRFAKQEGWEGVELDTKRPHAAPMDLSPDDRKELRDLAGELELPIAAVSPNSDFSSFIPEHQEAWICYVRECIKLTKDLGSPICKIFGAWRGVIVRDGLGDYRYTWSIKEPFPEWKEERWGNVRSALRELARFAEDHGVVLALQNHAPVISTEDDVLRMIKEVESPALKACLDHGTPETVRKAGPLLVHSHYNGEFRDDGRLVSTHKRDYGTYVDALVASGYDGYMNWEFCHPAKQDGQPAGIEYVHRVTREALQYMKVLRSEAEAKAGKRA